MSVRILVGDALAQLRTLPDQSVRCCVTSPPYFGLRDYGIAGQMGLEPTPAEYVAGMVAVFAEVRRVLADDGTLWLNLGDSYAGSGRGIGDTKTTNKGNGASRDMHDAMVDSGAIGRSWVKPPAGMNSKNMLGIPWRVAFALQEDGWYLRSDIIWAKPNPMPESVTDRPTKAHEYIFLLSKAQRYFYDADAISTPAAESSVSRLSQSSLSEQAGSERANGGAKTNGAMRAVFGGRNKSAGHENRKHSGREDEGNYIENGVNARTVWTIPTQSFKEAHFATFPPEIPRRCILAGSAVGDTVLDPFGGAGTTGLVADRLNRNAILIELNPKYAQMAERRIHADAPLFADVATENSDV